MSEYLNNYESDDSNPELLVRYKSFEEARGAKKGLSDTFISEAISARFTENYINSYLTNVDITPKDQEILDSPELIAKCYSDTTDMLIRNLGIKIASGSNPTENEENKLKVKEAKKLFIQSLKDQIPITCDQIIAWCESKSRKFPVDEMGYKGFNINNIDILDSKNNTPYVRANFKIQRQDNGVFIMAYSNSRVSAKMEESIDGHNTKNLDNRIYINPDISESPTIFEKILQQANDNGIELQLKMFQRAPELSSIRLQQKGNDSSSQLRGDGIVLYVNHEDADRVLQIVLSLAEESSNSFKDRKTSRIPQPITDGIAVGDEPPVPGYSLTSHRAELLSHVADKIRKFEKDKHELCHEFRKEFRDMCMWNNINPDNIAFNRKYS